eukprot:TRINITY_DN18071_c0_g1_i1.p1 TRINITY_DN18071_c0_g1~~TRINITY_DN18071_c0_g1_i1.p1  ORF type:complete len:338 (+),score=58.61 TRINITY_DN18071_c0_g1_i1:121-1134(+)
MCKELDIYLKGYTEPNEREWHQETSLYDFVYRCIFFSGSRALFGQDFFSDTLMEHFKSFDSKFNLAVAGIPLSLLGVLQHLNYIQDYMKPGNTDYTKTAKIIQARFEYLSNEISLSPKDTSTLQIAMLWASQANTIPAVFWTIFNVLSDSDCYSEIIKEINENLGESTDISTLDLDKLPKLDSAVSETLRLAASIMVIRKALEATEMDLMNGTEEKKYKIRKGDFVCIIPEMIHYDSEIYENPQSFKWNRFLGGAKFFKKGKRVLNYLTAFGGGVSMCPGRYFAQNEIKYFVIGVLHSLDLEIAQGKPDFDTSRSGLGILPPKQTVGFKWRRKTSVS